jgi:hypothetical protein
VNSTVAVQVQPPAADQAVWQMVCPVIAQNHPLYGRIDVKRADLQEMVDNFHAGAYGFADPSRPGKLRVPLEIAHDEKRGAAGWHLDLDLRDDGLYALTSYTEQGRKAVADDTYPYISPDFWDKAKSPVTGRTIRNVFRGSSLVERPMLSELPPARLFAEVAPGAFVFQEEPMTLNPDGTPAKLPDAPDQKIDGGAELATTGAGAADDGAQAPPPATGQPRLFAEPPADGSQAPSPVAPVPQLFGTPGAAEAATVDPKQFGELQQRLALMEREVRKRQFSEQLDAVTYHGREKLSPVTRESLAEIAADIYALNPELARRFGEAVNGFTTYTPGIVGLAGASPLIRRDVINAANAGGHLDENGLSEAELIEARRSGVTPRQFAEWKARNGEPQEFDHPAIAAARAKRAAQA